MEAGAARGTVEVREDIRRVMLAVDEHEGSFYALEWTLKNLHDSIIKFQPVPGKSRENGVLKVLIPKKDIFNESVSALYSLFIFGLFAAPEVGREVQEDQKKTAASLLENAREICIRHGITPETITDVGDPKDAIREEAVERLNIQLLVVGSHGRGALKRAFLGSVSNYCVHNMKCPVLVVKKP
ncbi:unnamed protein product [Coffea canephora]|uniref:UspA domain-containing protein n=1 Tax=Coffea canephora TaxID=49390 RepID=A0A068TWL1_COFCA|nr:unnamed protein product [Coffea canephora]